MRGAAVGSSYFFKFNLAVQMSNVYVMLSNYSEHILVKIGY